MAFGYHGRYLRIDVSRGSGEYVPLEDQVLRRFLGGSGLGVWLLLQEGAARLDPLAPEAPIVFAFSPLVGSPLTTSAKFAVVSKSPLTGRINDSLASSGFALAGTRCGCDAILIAGALAIGKPAFRRLRARTVSCCRFMSHCLVDPFGRRCLPHSTRCSLPTS